MEFKETEFSVILSEDLLFKIESTCGRIEIGVYPVIFGFRIRAGFAPNEGFYELDYCCGNEQKSVELIYSVVKNILEQKDYSPGMFSTFPRQDRKPFFNDVVNYGTFLSLMKEPYTPVKLPDIHSAKTLYLSKYF